MCLQTERGVIQGCCMPLIWSILMNEALGEVGDLTIRGRIISKMRFSDV